MRLTVILAALFCVVCSPSFACDAMRPCYGNGRLLYGANFKSQSNFDASGKSYRSTKNTVRRAPPGLRRVMAEGAGHIVSHPAGCPRVAFCACGALKRLAEVWGVTFKNPRSLWRAANWFRFPRTSPAPGTVAVRRHHVFVLEQHIGGSTWLVYDANSGWRRTRIHARSIAGYVIVQPRGV